MTPADWSEADGCPKLLEVDELFDGWEGMLDASGIRDHQLIRLLPRLGLALAKQRTAAAKARQQLQKRERELDSLSERRTSMSSSSLMWQFGQMAEAMSRSSEISWGQRDFLLIPRQSRRAARAIPGARLVTLRGCGHVPTYDDPQLVAEVLLAGSRPAPIVPARRESAATAG